MKSNLFKILVLLLCVSMAFFVVSCKKKKDKNQSKPSIPTQSEIESEIESKTESESETESTSASESVSESESQSESKPEHTCDYTELKYNSTHHWYECSCGAKDNATEQAHEGGNATCTEKAVCTTCNQEYGSTLAHEYNVLRQNPTHHWYECSCGAKDNSTEQVHNPSAPADAHNDQICTICNYVIQQATGILFNTLSVDGAYVYGKVSNTTAVFSFITEVKVNGKCKFVVSLDLYGGQTVATKTIPLEIGDNTVYITEIVNDEPINVYTVTIRRRPIYTVAFNVNGGTDVASQQIEEDSFATEPTTQRAGYDFVSWDYDFASPITNSITINASWRVHTNTKYKVEYYLQNLEDDNYTLDHTDELEGITDTTANAEIKNIEHFTYNVSKSITSGNINSDGSRVLKVYYTRDKYTVSTTRSISKAGSVIGSGTYKFNKQITITVTPYLGYYFVGWYNGEELLSQNNTYTVKILGDISLTAKFEVKEEMANFNFTSTITTCSITGIKDKTVTEIVVPDYVTSISGGAFSGCSNLQSITLPFVGGSKTATKASKSTLFGYIFGTSSYTGSTPVKQYYQESGSSYSATYYIPTSLTQVTITGGNILCGAFYNCSRLTSVIIGDSVTSIGEWAFNSCNSLTSVVMPASGINIGEDAFYGCNKVIIEYESCKYLSSADNPYYALIGVTSKNYSSYTIHSDTVVIAYGAFEDCSRMGSITIPDSVKNIGSYAFSSCSSLTSVYITDLKAWCEIEFGDFANPLNYGEKLYLNGELLEGELIIPEGTSKMGNYAFYKQAITSVVIPDSVTSIGSYAFGFCSSLTSVVIGDSVTSIGERAFYNCSSLTSVVIGDSVTSIGSSAFQSCSSLTSIVMPASGINIGLYAFSGCNKVIIEYENCKYLSSANNPYYALIGVTNKNYSSYTIHSDTVVIAYGAFEDCSRMGSITIPDSVKNISSRAFDSCSSLTSVVIGDSVTTIGEDAFYYCESLTSVVIGDSVTSIGSWAFYYCESLTSVYITDLKAWCEIEFYDTYANPLYCGAKLYLNGELLTELVIPDGITSINKYAFDSCTSLTSVVIGDSVTSIGSYAFEDCYNLTSVVIGDSVTSIGSSAFEDCTRLPSVVIGDSVTSIGSSAFYNCYSLTSVVIPDSVTSIGSDAFNNCSRLTSVVIGESVTKIGSYAFYGCSSLTSIKYKGTSSQWLAISKGSNWNYKAGEFTVTYNYQGE